MTVIDKLNEVNKTIKEMFKFVQTSEITRDDFSEYIKAMGAENVSPAQMEKLFIPYAFERKLNIPPKSAAELFYENGNPSNPEIAKSLANVYFSVFEIQNVRKNGFQLCNLIAEKTCEVLSLTKMTSFRGLGAGDFITARIFKHNGEYYLIGIESTYGRSEYLDAIHCAVYEMTKTPWLAYEENPETEEKIKQDIEIMYAKFKELFLTDEVVTTNRYADDIIGILCSATDEEEYEDFDMDEFQKPLENYEFFEVEELENTARDFMTGVPSGFSTHEKLYDVGIIFDEESGLYSIPFYKTFCKIFEENCEVKNVKECVEYFLTHNSVSDVILKRIALRYPNFVSKINEVLNTNYTFDELISVFKPDFLKHKIYSSTSTLYCSNLFSVLIDFYENMREDIESLEDMEENSIKNGVPVQYAPKIGRNAPCPCGSGKKYKNCCLNQSVR